jgi:hypothetical protein
MVLARGKHGRVGARTDPLKRSWTRVASALAASGLTALAVLTTLTSSGPPRPPRLAGQQRERIAASIAEREPALRSRSRAQFPGDLWSQGDAYHAHEQELVRRAAAQAGVSVGSVLDALDGWLRAHPSSDHPDSVSPCKPRPYYD